MCIFGIWRWFVFCKSSRKKTRPSCGDGIKIYKPSWRMAQVFEARSNRTLILPLGNIMKACRGHWTKNASDNNLHFVQPMKWHPVVISTLHIKAAFTFTYESLSVQSVVIEHSCFKVHFESTYFCIFKYVTPDVCTLELDECPTKVYWRHGLME